MRIQPKGKAVYQLKVTLLGTKPPIWRRFLVPSGISLADLDASIQSQSWVGRTATSTGSWLAA